MNFEAQLVDSSRIIADMVAENVGDNQDHFNKLMELSFRGKPKISMRASRVATLCVEKHPHLIEPHLDRIIYYLPTDESIRKNFLKVLAETSLSFNEDQLGYLFDNCFEILISEKSSIASKAYSMHILYNISQIEPDLKIELISAIEEEVPKGSSGIKYIGRAILKKLYKETGKGDQ